MPSLQSHCDMHFHIMTHTAMDVHRFEVSIEVKIRLVQNDTMAFLATGITRSGCYTFVAAGLFLAISNSNGGGIVVYENLGKDGLFYQGC